MYRIVSCKAWVEKPEEALAIEITKRMHRAYRSVTKIRDYQEGRRFLTGELGDLWYPNRHMVTNWYILHSRQNPSLQGVEREEPRGIVLAGVFSSSHAETFSQLLSRPETIRASVTEADRARGRHHRQTYRIRFPVLTKNSTSIMDIRFMPHRALSNEDWMFRHFFLVGKPRIHSGKTIGYSWRLNLLALLPDPTPRTGKRVSSLTPTWEPTPDGRLVVMRVERKNAKRSTLIREYCLPPGTISRARRAIGLMQQGISNEEYTNFVRWREDLYRKWAKEICASTDAIALVGLSAEHAASLLARHRRIAHPSYLLEVIKTRARRDGVHIEKMTFGS
ncbi:MAG: hypothetical protein ACYDCW_01890 [Acidithiobacillus ferrivorans]